MMKLRSKKLSRSFSRLRGGGGSGNDNGDNLGGCDKGCGNATAPVKEIKWEVRPGGMLVQKREIGGESVKEGIIMIRVATGSQWHDISIQATSTFGELKMILSLVTSLEAKEQRLLFKGKEREDGEYLHMVGVGDKDKVLLLQDPANKQRKLLGLERGNAIGAPYRTISV